MTNCFTSETKSNEKNRRKEHAKGLQQRRLSQKVAKMTDFFSTNETEKFNRTGKKRLKKKDFAAAMGLYQEKKEEKKEEHGLLMETDWKRLLHLLVCPVYFPREPGI